MQLQFNGEGYDYLRLMTPLVVWINLVKKKNINLISELI